MKDVGGKVCLNQAKGRRNEVCVRMKDVECKACLNQEKGGEEYNETASSLHVSIPECKCRSEDPRGDQRLGTRRPRST